MNRSFVTATILVSLLLIAMGCHPKEINNPDETAEPSLLKTATREEAEYTLQIDEIEEDPPSTADDKTVPKVTPKHVIITDTGKYSGQADSNFIEIQISGVPDENAFKIFILSQDLKSRFEDLNLKTGETLKFSYYLNDDAQNVIISIEKI